MPFNSKKEGRYKSADFEKKFTVYRPKYRISSKKQKNEQLTEICKFCIYSHALYNSDTMLCDRKGIVSGEKRCRRFTYDPLKHIPVQTPPLVVDEEEILTDLDLESDSDNNMFGSIFHAPEGEESSPKEDSGKTELQEASQELQEAGTGFSGEFTDNSFESSDDADNIDDVSETT